VGGITGTNKWYGFDARETRMCFKQAPSETEVAREERDRDARRQHDPRRPWRNTRPKGNGHADRQDVERGMERLASLVGR
jgi:hypothetical protein